mmetsp:Transcript_69400/g.219634  ORF Transcript_69400/g.219634 Transcript_69400/m.219634 type:complete len:436 (+) Transcript_69400:172-1479(+)|eukprot:CAMPEP_0182913496 /NCGR_PEP_ID=MMETSP0034_2-20130328/38071_1 /TAXON_ID=156128 /ORGANISM="Nephroselmis pyriformis, Strain CCMP717" /LENGTH=435 /DNA_ID=CAMNT_0025050223 /DNA_START=135 /DNA_END=1442 /DNA_ORIENTATION=+
MGSLTPLSSKTRRLDRGGHSAYEDDEDDHGTLLERGARTPPLEAAARRLYDLGASDPLLAEAPRVRMPAYMRYLLLIGQIVLSSIHVILVHTSKHAYRSAEGGSGVMGTQHGNEQYDYPYSTVMVVLLSEAIKLAVSLIAFLWQATRPPKDRDSKVMDLREQLSRSLSVSKFIRFSIPAIVYTLENNLRFVVLKALASPITWVVFGHMEIPIVAVMTRVFLKRRLSKIQWVSIVLLLNGVMASQVAVCESQLHTSCHHLSDFPILQLLVVCFAAFLAASAGIATEFLFQADFQSSIFIQNAQLYTFGILCNVVVLYTREYDRIVDGRLLEGLGEHNVVAVTLTMAGMGLCVSAVVKHMSNVAKVYASATGIFITAFLSAMVSQFELSLPFLLASVVVVCSLYLYALEKDRKESAEKIAEAYQPLSGQLDSQTGLV